MDTVLILGVVALGGILILRQAAKSGTQQPPNLGSGPSPAPTGPSARSDVLVDSWRTQVANVQLWRTPTRFVVRTRSEPLGPSEVGFPLDQRQEAREFAESQAFFFGVPMEGETLIDWVIDGQRRAAIWRSRNGSFVISFVMPADSGRKGWYGTLDSARTAMAEIVEAGVGNPPDLGA